LIGKLCVPVNVAEASEEFDRTRKYRLVNVRTAMYWKLREALDPDGGQNLALAPDPEPMRDLTVPTYKVQANGIVVEPKPDIEDRIGRSTDAGDAVCLAHWRPKRWRLDVWVG
jgi:hypothetical protein